MMQTIYMGYDSREELAYDVAQSSIVKRSNGFTTIIPMALTRLGGILTRPIEQKDGKMWCPISEAPMATEFAISRFCVPFLQKTGWALFVDCDIVCLTDIGELFALADPKYAVMCVKHNQGTGGATKMDGQVQTYYSRKNWSSVVLWNCEHAANQNLTLEALNTWPGRDLHAFKWLADDLIGELHHEWNHLVGVDQQSQVPKLAHFTLGGPWLKDWKGGPMDDIWLREREAM